MILLRVLHFFQGYDKICISQVGDFGCIMTNIHATYCKPLFNSDTPYTSIHLVSQQFPALIGDGIVPIVMEFK
jgi:hypothetical protein